MRVLHTSSDCDCARFEELEKNQSGEDGLSIGNIQAEVVVGQEVGNRFQTFSKDPLSPIDTDLQ